MDFTVQNLADLGKVACHRAYYGEDLTNLLPPRLREVLVVAVEVGTRLVTLDEGFASSWRTGMRRATSADRPRTGSERSWPMQSHGLATWALPTSTTPSTSRSVPSSSARR
ncbi:MAG: hypothetical protein M0Z95_04010 [Actinomycetota bacterium]|jgi:hypothetical protein|nr:hypothetical protein [Actinomycetota bacterium]